MISKYMNILGIKSDCWAMHRNPLALGEDSNRFIYSLENSFLVREFKKFLSLRYVLIYDVVFFNFGSTLFMPFPKYRFDKEVGWNYIRLYIYSHYRKMMQIIEVSFLKLMEVKVVVQYQGSDARQKDYCRNNYDFYLPLYDGDYTKSDRLRDVNKREQINIFNKISSRIYSLNPDLMNVLPNKTKFLPYCHIDLNIWKPSNSVRNNGTLKIGHAPSKRNVKGTEDIIQCVSNLRKESDVEFEFILIENVCRNEARKLYEGIDLLIDQLYAGWYGGVAVELMALGKPVLCYLRESDLSYIPKGMKDDLPIINVNPTNLEKVLIDFFKLSFEQIHELGMRSRRYVDKWHDPQKNVSNLARELELLNNFT